MNFARSEPLATAQAAREPRNIACLVAYQVVARVGWIFKTETVIMPAVLDACIDSGLLRGVLPVLNRAGNSLFPLLIAPAVARQPVVRWLLAATTTGLAGSFLLLAAIWSPMVAHHPQLLAACFLVIYGIFSVINGCNQLLVATLQGRLITAGHRGRVLLLSVTIGSVLAISVAVVALGPWLKRPDGFPLIFTATGGFFLLAAAVPGFFNEPPLQPGSGERRPEAVETAPFWTLLKQDRAVLRLAIVAAGFSAVLILFPHYQAFARTQFGTGSGSLLTWVIVQNVATGLASLVVGPLADRRGNRMVLIGLIGCCTATPLTVVGLAGVPIRMAADWFWLAYLPLGLNPITLRIISNYALELAPTVARQPRYVSLIGAALAAPFVLAPLIGWLIDRVGAVPIFLAGAVVIGLTTVAAIGLPEPRQQTKSK
jgi:predicted MFS family arabinose efflux permease